MRLAKEGQKIRDTYVVERYLGEGAFAEVYRVAHRFLGRQAMKIFKTPEMSLAEIEKGLEEAVLLSRMGHPNIVRVYDANVFESKNGALGFFTMEYVAGGSLDHYWQSHAGTLMSAEAAVEIIRQACRGLKVAHDEDPPVIHRDLKPQNILVGYDAAGLRIRLSDFGLAKKVNPLTLLASTKGTLLFKSPEAIVDMNQDSSAGDVWALGATLYLILTDRLPYPPIQEHGWMQSDRFSRPYPPPSQLNFNVDPQLDSIIAKALAIDVKDRYRNAGQFLADLERWSPPDDSIPKASKTKPDESKSALGAHPPASAGEAEQKAKEAFELANLGDQITDAADLLEEAITEWPALADKYEYQLSLWRRGVLM